MMIFTLQFLFSCGKGSIYVYIRPALSNFKVKVYFGIFSVLKWIQGICTRTFQCITSELLQFLPLVSYFYTFNFTSYAALLVDNFISINLNNNLLHLLY